MICTEPTIPVIGKYNDTPKVVHGYDRDNFRFVHLSGTVSLEIAGEVVKTERYSSLKHRKKLLDKWTSRITYPHIIIINPNWELWNGRGLTDNRRKKVVT